MAPQLSGEWPDYDFTLILDEIGGPEREPYSLPGGYIFVPASLILRSRNEADVAQMLAHAMAHRFPMISGQTSAYGSIPLIFVGGSLRSGSLLIPPSYRAQQAAIERNADQDAAQAVIAAGYAMDLPAPPSAAFLALQQEVRRALRGSPLR